MLPSSVRLRQAAALFGATAVLTGAFGAHALRDSLEPAQVAIWQTAVNYLFWHVLAALFAVRSQSGVEDWRGRVAALLFLSGLVIFSGSLFALALSAPRPIGMLTPVGGICLIAGWLALAWSERRT